MKSAQITFSRTGSLIGLISLGLHFSQTLQAQTPEDGFRQLEEVLPTANDYRAASGAPGRDYWQQRADYVIDVELDDESQRIIGSETITYTNQSPDALKYIWVQLDQNRFAPGGEGQLATSTSRMSGMSFKGLRAAFYMNEFKGGVQITAVRNAEGDPLKYQIVKTMMRIDLQEILRSGQSVVFSIAWNHKIIDADLIRSRGGYEFFEKDGNFIYEMAQWFPRMAAYTDYQGWQHKQFLGSGEFTLEFGDYDVRITVPADHVVASTGELQNPGEVLSPIQKERYERAKTADAPIFIITPEEALENEQSKITDKKTWVFHAENIRDFAFASSRKFIWDAQGHPAGERNVMAMSFYPNEGEPLWSRYSTHSIIHTLNVYSKFTFPYPYPVAISVNGPVGGMEYPMICFNGPRPEEDGTYSKNTKYGLISVIIHEVGHNYFPMIVNSDERQWTWMDEGLNTFLQFLAEQEWETDYPSRRGEPKDIVRYMTSSRQVPIMTNSESILQFGPNAYGKPATALNILRETIMGRELFDFAFREYAQRWQFKRPNPADLFRTLEDASGVDLDWFWRGWFYTTQHTDIAVSNVRLFTIDTQDPDIEKPLKKAEREEDPQTFSQKRNVPLKKRADIYPHLLDFYNDFDELDVTDDDRKQFEKQMKKLDDKDKALLKSPMNFYLVDFENLGGLLMPVIFDLKYENGSSEEIRIPAEIWRRNHKKVTKLIITARTLKSVEVDPRLETADSDTDNNYFPRRIQPSRFELAPSKKSENPMQKAGLGKVTEEGQDKDSVEGETESGN
ncbi:MAG TPA: M1 family peptidase [Verrucomicrobiales bacterium]|nr:M1 family peptidase [Verrucomicrobiales bacterium]